MVRNEAARVGPREWALLAGGAFGALGGGSAAAFLRSAHSGTTLVPLAALAAVLVGSPLWYLLVERAEAGTALFRRAGLAGATTGLLAHPVLWALFALTLVGDPTLVAPLRAGAVDILYGTLSALFAGGVTVPLGAVGGFGLAGLRVLSRRVG